MGCCRGKQRRTGHPQTVECKTMEQAGSGFLLWPLVTRDGVRVTVRTNSNGFVELSSFLQAYRCEGSVARMLQRYAPDISRLASTNPSTLLPHSRSGISLANIVSLAAPPRHHHRRSSSSRRSRKHGQVPPTQ